MKRILFYLALTVVLCNYTACTNAGKTTFSQLSFQKMDPRGMIVRKGNDFFTGTAWSNDGKTCSIEVDGGALTSFTVYHNNGVVAYRVDGQEHILFCNDENGNEMRKRDFREKYRNLMLRLEAICKEAGME